MSAKEVLSSSPRGHIYTVEIRFSGDGLNPVEISERTGLTPSTTWIGPATASASRSGHPVWGYNGEGEAGFQPEWLSLEEGLGFVTGRLLHVRATLLDFSRIYRGVWWCGHFQTSFDGGPTLSPQLLGRLASFGLPLFIDNYFEAGKS